MRLFKINVLHHKKLSIIDSYGIIKDLLIYYDESACEHHYLCNLQSKGEHYYHTPSGDAIISNILLSLI